MTRGIQWAIALAMGWSVVSLSAWLGLRTALPAFDATQAAIVVTAVLAITAGLIATLPRLRGAVGLNTPSHWRALHLLILPTAIVFAPLVAGIKPIEPSTFWLLVLGYALTGFAEETMFRGIVLKLLDRHPAVTAVLVSSLLFGLVHLNNIVIRGEPAIIFAQAVGAFTFGIGYAALRLRLNTIWPLIVLHMLHDLVLHVGTLPLIPVDVAQDVVLVCYGAWLLWGMRANKA